MRDRDFGMCFHWSNLRHFDQAKTRFAPEHHHLHTGRNLLRNDSSDNGSMLRLRRPWCHHIFIVLFERVEK